MPPPPPLPPTAKIAASRPLAGVVSVPALALPPIAGRYAVEATRPLPGAGGGGVGGGLAAFVALDRREPSAQLMAVQVRPGAPPRALGLALLSGLKEPTLLAPIAHGAALGGDGQPATFLICAAPVGPPLWPVGATTIAPWGEAELMTRLLRPVAAALIALQDRRVTHRAVRPHNIFAGADRGPAVLGCAWAAPPAMFQPAVFEPPNVAMCPGAGRGDGSIADDVYALGVTMLALALGRLPLAGLDDDAVIRRKLELGCFQALAGDAKLPSLVTDLLGPMLAPDPLHRPPPTLLADPATARARRVASRPPNRAPTALMVGKRSTLDSRTLGYAIAREPEHGARMLRLGVIDHWLRRVLGDGTLGAKIEDAVRQRAADPRGEPLVADAKLVMHAVALLDPQAPLCWNGLALWPDAVGTALAAGPDPDGLPDGWIRARAEAVVVNEAVVLWGSIRGGDVDTLRMGVLKQRKALRLRSWAGGLPRLTYALNPLLACRSPSLGGWPVAQLPELLPALEAASARMDLRASPPIDRDLAAFIGAHEDGLYDEQMAVFGEPGKEQLAAVAQLKLLALMQAQLKAGPLPGLAAWLTAAVAPTLSVWRNRVSRDERQAALDAAVPRGELSALISILQDPPALKADEQGFATAVAVAESIDYRLAVLAGSGAMRGETAARLGQEIAAALGLAALAVSAIAVALG